MRIAVHIVVGLGVFILCQAIAPSAPREFPFWYALIAGYLIGLVASWFWQAWQRGDS